MLSVLDRLFWAVTDARHTMRTCPSPDRLSVFDRNIVKRAHIGAFTAGNAIAGGIKFLGMDEHGIEEVIDNPAVEVIPKENICLRKLIAILNISDRLLYHRFRLLNNL